MNPTRPGEVDWTERMSTRARGYLSIAGARHLLIGLACIIGSDLFDSPAFIQIKQVLPITLWGVLFLTNAALCLAAAVVGHGGLARTSLIYSAASTAVWAGGFIAAFVAALETNQPLTAPTGVVIYLAVAGKDLVVCRNPMRSPFEDLGQRILEAEARDGRP